MNDNDKEPTLEFTDKRRVSAETNGEAAAEHGAPNPAAEEDARQPAEGMELPEMDVNGILRTSVSLLANGAWAWMGLTPNPFTGKMTRDLEQAKTAIDTIAFLVDKLDPSLSADERNELRNLVSMLRINFVQQSQA